MKQTRKHSKKAFTMLEMLIVMIIMGILIAITVVSFEKIKQNASNENLVSQARQVIAALEKYKSECRVYPVTIAINSFGGNGRGANNGYDGEVCSKYFGDFIARDIPLDKIIYHVFERGTNGTGNCTHARVGVLVSTNYAGLSGDADWSPIASQYASCGIGGTNNNNSSLYNDAAGFYDFKLE
jgi:prepilin-type N-terminal cleavage/methylation domain-containing protein